MAEDQGKPEPEGATLPKDEPEKLEEKPPEKPVDGQEEHDEGSQSINLELEEDEEPKADDDKLHNAKNETETDKQEKKEEADPEPAAEEAKADAGPPRSDPKPEEKKQDEPEQELPAEKVTEESEPPTDTQELDTAAKDDSQAQKEDKEEEIEKQEPQPKAEEKKPAEEAEVGIVGPPTAASELLADEELVATEKATLPTNDTSPKISDRVARWVEASKADEPDELVDDVDDEDKELDEEEEEEGEQEQEAAPKKRGRKRKQSNGTNGGNNKKAHKVVNNIIRRSIRCLNKMHAMDGSGAGGGGEKKATDPTAESKPSEEDSSKSPKVPQSQQNGAALPEETASADRNLTHCQATPSKREKKETETEAHQQPQPLRTKSPKSELSMITPDRRPGRPSNQQRKLQQQLLQQQLKMQQQHQQEDQQQRPPSRETRKRRAAESCMSGSGANLSSNGSSSPKKISLDQREQFINSLIGSDKFTAEQLATRAEQLRAEVQDLDELARAKEMEWNEILSMRKLKEEAYLRIERRRQVMGFMEGNGPVAGSESPLPPASLALSHHQQQQQQQQQQQHQHHHHHHQSYESKPALLVPKEERDVNNPVKRERAAKSQSTYQPLQPKIQAENGPKQQQQQQQLADAQSPDQRQIGEGRQGPIVDVRSIIADYRLRHPDTLPKRRGRRMRNSVNVGLGAGGAVVENLGNMDSRPSSTDSCKSNSNANDPNNAMSFKDVLVQFAKLSQQQGEPIKTPQNYPDVTLHPVTAAPTTTNSVPQTSGSLLHGILTKSQSPRPTTFSPTLARLLTAPERERSAPTIITPLHQAATQHLLQAYQGANPVSISDFLSSSKARTEITITPVVNNPAQTHSNNLINVDDGEDESSIIEERDSRLSMGNRDNREDRDSPPRCQGCHERSAQFVCAGCGNQWYCSRECQVAAWDEHSEVCSG